VVQRLVPEPELAYTHRVGIMHQNGYRG
jgi:hypothetical protein